MKKEKISSALSIFLIFLLFSIVFATHLHFEPHDTDMWVHLTVGKLLYETHSFPEKDVFTFTRLGEPWELHEWMYQLLVYIVYYSFGLTGLLVFKSLAIVIALLLLFFLLPSKGYTRIAAVLTVNFLLLPFSSIRPQLISWIFLLGLLILIQKKKFWTVPLLLLIWGNFHPLHLLGLLVAIIFMGEHFLRTKNLKIVLLIVLSVVAVTLNPLGVNVFTLPFAITSPFITEWKPFSPHGFFFYVYTAFVLVGVLFFLFQRAKDERRVQKKYEAHEVLLWLKSFSLRSLKYIFSSELLIYLLFITLGYLSRRHVAQAFLLLTPFFVRNIPFLNGSAMSDRTQRKDVMFVAALAIVFILSMFLFVNVSFPSTSVPEKEVEIIQKYNITGNVFNNYAYGSYLEFWLYPKNLMYIDSRAETMGEELLHEYYSLGTKDRGSFLEIADKYNVTVIIVKHNMGLTNIILNSAPWKPIYVDATRASFVRKMPSTEDVPTFDVLESGLVENRNS